MDKYFCPSQFDKLEFMIAAFDNFDHEESTLSGIQGSHDTVSVLFQEKPVDVHRKPNIWETNIQKGRIVFQEQLPCQQLHEYTIPAKKPDLPQEYTVSIDRIQLTKPKLMTENKTWLGHLEEWTYPTLATLCDMP